MSLHEAPSNAHEQLTELVGGFKLINGRFGLELGDSRYQLGSVEPLRFKGWSVGPTKPRAEGWRVKREANDLPMIARE